MTKLATRSSSRWRAIKKIWVSTFVGFLVRLAGVLVCGIVRLHVSAIQSVTEGILLVPVAALN